MRSLAEITGIQAGRVALPGDPQGPPAVASAPISLGAEQAQQVQAIAYTRYVVDLNVTITENTFAVPLVSGQQHIDLSGQAINTLVLNPSIRGNPVYYALGQASLEWTVLAGQAYPWADYRVSQDSLVVRLSTRRIWDLVCCVYPGALTANYQDGVRVVALYLPDADLRIMEAGVVAR